MNRPSRPARVLATALAAGTLLGTAACSQDGGTPEAASVSPAAQRPTPSPTTALTGAGAKAALITEADIEDGWTQVNNAATWRNELLVGKVDAAQFLSGKTRAAECQKLLDSLYSDTLLGRPKGASALTGFTAQDYRLLYQVGDYEQAPLRQAMDWVKTLPQDCAQFSATAADGSERTVQVIEAALPEGGDEQHGLTVRVQGTADGQPTTLVLDVAAFRIGSAAATVTNGGPSGADHASTERAVQQGAERLAGVLSGKTPTANPSLFD
ncbi:hypothetical protein [Streptomyces sp. NPDC005209]|uniref:hypothetical protein n=1 Tax=Streptomyces sp. NPDC005209 TaxID=3156715 RepID=UPI0033B4FC59